MARDFLTDAEVELEIDRLVHSDAVKLAKKETAMRYKRRQYMYSLRVMEKRGKELMKQGIDMENIEERLFGDAGDEL